jgi:mxaD protein
MRYAPASAVVTISKGQIMQKRTLVLALLALTAPWCALGAPLKPLSVVETVDIKAPVAKVWAATKDFDSLHKWHPGFAKDVITKGRNNAPGAVRALTIKDGPTFTEELLAFNESEHTYQYRIIESPLPLQDYVATFTVKPGAKEGTTQVTWSAKFTRKNPSDNPPESESDAAAVKLITGVFQGGLANLKKLTEG